MYSVNLLGTLQFFAGIEGASVGSPNWAVASPAEFMDASCIHLTDLGYIHMFDTLWDEFFAKHENSEMSFVEEVFADYH